MEFIIASDSLSKLQKIMSGAGARPGGDTTNPIMALRKVMEKMSIGTVTKLAGIALGISALTGFAQKIWSLLVTSSPMLQSMLKLFQVGIMFMLRPIGDFIGFLLRPMMIYLLRSVFLPWYRQMAPIMRMWGTELGTGLVNFLKDPFGSLVNFFDTTFIGKVLAGFFPVFGITVGIGKLIDLVSALDIDFGEINAAVGENVRRFFESITTALTGWWGDVLISFEALESFISGTLGIINTVIGSSWNTFTTFFNDVLGNVGAALSPAISGFYEWMSTNLGGVEAFLKSAWDNFTSFFSTIGGVWTLLGDSWNNFISFIGDLGNILNSLNPGNFFSELGTNLQSGVQNMFNQQTTVKNNVNVDVAGGGFDVDGLKNMLFGWLEDHNTMRY